MTEKRGGDRINKNWIKKNNKYMSSVNSCIIYYKYTLNDTIYYKNTILLKVSSNPKKLSYKQEMFQKHICPLGANSKLLLICTRHYDFRTLYKAELNIIK